MRAPQAPGAPRVAAMVVFVFAADVANRVPRAIRERPLREIGVIVTDNGASP